MSWRRWLAALLPAAFGIIGATLIALVPDVPNPIVAIRVDLGTLLLILGVVSSLPILVGAASQELTERGCRSELEKAHEEAAEERRRFLRRLDHELKNPLTAIRIGLANLAGEHPDRARSEAFTSVEAEVLRLNRLTADLRKLADLETRPLERTSVDAADLLEEVYGVIQEQPEARDRRIALVLPKAPWPVPAIQGDRDLLSLALYNLLDNALKFTHDGDTVELRAFDDGNAVVIEVADTGPGIPEPEIPRVWEELYRGQDARGVRGSGLGLALVQAVVERHGGTARIRSRTGQGTVVRMTLPVR